MSITGNKIIVIESVDSTQNMLKSMLSCQSIPEGTLVIADEQTMGRGMTGNIWESEKGLNLTFSFVWYPRFLEVSEQFRMNMAISLSVCDFVKSKTQGNGVKIKWPNDIYIGHKKVAGILIENSILNNVLQSSVIGVGVNINQMNFPGNVPNPVSLKMITGEEYETDTCIRQLCCFLDIRYRELKENSKLLENDYLENMYRFGILAPYAYKDKNISAIIKGVNGFGYLILQLLDGKEIECDMKEIRFVGLNNM